MKNKIFSDQFYNWTDTYERKVNRLSSPKTKNTFREATESTAYSTWVFNKALQALWQTWMQLCTWTWSRPQILFISEQTRAKATNGLCPPGLLGKGKRASGKLSKDKSYPGGTLRDQPGTFKTQGEVLGRAPPNLRGRKNGNILDRCGRDSHSLY